MTTNSMFSSRAGWSLATSAIVALFSTPLQAGGSSSHSQWTVAEAQTAINSTAGDGCPIESEDGLSLLIASNRAGGFGGNDIWAADRDSLDAPWQAPRNLGEPINSSAADFCPTPVLGRWLFFVSERAGDGTGPTPCGGGDIHLSRQSPARGWSSPEMLKCAPEGPNFAGGERSPSLVQTWYGTYALRSPARRAKQAQLRTHRALHIAPPQTKPKLSESLPDSTTLPACPHPK